MHQRSDLHDPEDSTPIHKNVTQGLQTSPSLWLFCASSSALTQHSNLLSYIDDTDIHLSSVPSNPRCIFSYVDDALIHVPQDDGCKQRTQLKRPWVQ